VDRRDLRPFAAVPDVEPLADLPGLAGPFHVWLLGDSGYASPYWLTYRQAQERGGQVRRGEHGRLARAPQ
jgi:antirestriction factor ArdC-like protein